MDDYQRAHAAFIAQLREKTVTYGTFTHAQLNTAVSDADVAITGANTFTGAQTLSGTPINLARSNITQHATTMNLWAATAGNVLDGTGAGVTITAIANAPQAGASRDFYPRTGTILTQGAMFDIDGGVSRTSAAGECWTFVAKTTSTYRVFVRKADGTAVVAPAATSFASAAENIAGTIENKAVDPLGIREAFNTTGSAPVYACRAWVNFNGSANTNLSGTYSQSGTTVTVTATAHGLLVGSQVYSDITTGTAVDGLYTVTTVADANTFTYTAGTSLTTSGNVTLIRSTIRASGNVSSVTDNGTGDYLVNFATALPDANYAAVGLTGPKGSNSESMTCFAYTAYSVRVQSHSGAAALGDTANNNVAVFR